MTLEASEPTRCTLGASDGDVGTVHDLLIEGDDWHVRYLVADTRKWLPGRKVRVSPDHVEHIDWVRERMMLAVERERPEDAADDAVAS